MLCRQKTLPLWKEVGCWLQNPGEWPSWAQDPQTSPCGNGMDCNCGSLLFQASDWVNLGVLCQKLGRGKGMFTNCDVLSSLEKPKNHVFLPFNVLINRIEWKIVAPQCPQSSWRVVSRCHYWSTIASWEKPQKGWDLLPCPPPSSSACPDPFVVLAEAKHTSAMHSTKEWVKPSWVLVHLEDWFLSSKEAVSNVGYPRALLGTAFYKSKESL